MVKVIIQGRNQIDDEPEYTANLQFIYINVFKSRKGVVLDITDSNVTPKTPKLKKAAAKHVV